MIKILILLVLINICYSFHILTKSSLSSSLCNIQMNSINSNSLPILVTHKSSKLDDFVSYISTELKYKLNYGKKYLNNINDINDVNNNEQQQNIIIIDANDINDISSLKEYNAIYIMTEEEPNKVIINDDIRKKCKFDLYLPYSTNSLWTGSSKRLIDLLQKIKSPIVSEKDTLLDAGIWSHFVSLTFPSIDVAVPSLPALRIGADAFELRVDLLDDISVQSLHRQIALLRDSCPLPIVYTVRSVGQIGKFPPEPERIFKLLEEGLRAGIEWIDVEACWPTDQMDRFTSFAKSEYSITSRLLGSLYVTTPQSKEETEKLFSDSSLNHKADVLKVVTGAANDIDCTQIHDVGETMGKPYIGICLGAAGSRSRVLNKRFTPVTHPLMATAAPGQLSVEQLMKRRIEEKLIIPKKFYLFGTPIKQSLSPAMHNGAYKALLLPHEYGLAETEDCSSYSTLLADPTFGGASVTIPHKESIMPMLDEISGAAKIIGAVNTIVIDENGKKIGYNTDWLGMTRPILRQLRKKSIDLNTKKGIGLVAGAGGTAKAACYTINELGLELYITNRSPEKGKELAKSFGGKFIPLTELDTLIDAMKLEVVISTVPASASFTLPSKLLSNRPVILDVVYKPARTGLIDQAINNNCPFIQGATMLLEQGMEQFELWNKRRAPKEIMDAAVFGGVERLDKLDYIRLD